MNASGLLELGYITEAAFDEVCQLDDRKIRLLAMLALTHHESPWSDARRDLYRGVSDVVGRLPRCERVEEDGVSTDDHP